MALAGNSTVGDGDMTILDRAAALPVTDDNLAERQALYATTAGLQVPETVQHVDHFEGFEWRAVMWRQEA